MQIAMNEEIISDDFFREPAWKCCCWIKAFDVVGRTCSLQAWLSLAFFLSLVFEDKPLVAFSYDHPPVASFFLCRNQEVAWP